MAGPLHSIVETAGPIAAPVILVILWFAKSIILLPFFHMYVPCQPLLSAGTGDSQSTCAVGVDRFHLICCNSRRFDVAACASIYTQFLCHLASAALIEPEGDAPVLNLRLIS